MTPGFAYVKNALHCDGVSLSSIASDHGTPLYVYSGALIRANYRRIAKAFAASRPTIAYSVKANTNRAILRLLAQEGAAFDIVSGGELERVQRAGVAGDRIIFAGVGKSEPEIRAALKANVCEFNVESEQEAIRVNEIARSMKKVASLALRVNPNVDPKTHRYISTGKKENKFGLWYGDALTLSERIATMKNVRLEGLHAHIGSQILDSAPHCQAVAVLDQFLGDLAARGQHLKSFNFGGGFGIAYTPGQKPLDLKPVATAVAALVKRRGVKLYLEPGRSIVGPAGVLLTRVEYLKQGHDRLFVIVDAAMTELIRPALYSAHHEILPVARTKAPVVVADIVGPVCESADFLAEQREIARPEPRDLLAVRDAGAYASCMGSNYNSRPRPAEVLVDGGKAHLVRKRQAIKDLVKDESVPGHLR